MITRMCRWLAGLATVVALTLPGQAATTQYVDAAVVGGDHDGTSWANAYTNVQDALAVTAMSNQIWVAQGVYKPGTTEDSAFWLVTNGLALYGGFASGMAALGERNWTSYVTMLSGDIGVAGDWSDNCSNVVVISACTNAVLDGFTIAYGGNTNTVQAGYGAGISIPANMNATIANCTIVSNRARYGGGVFNNHASAATLVTNCLFLDNLATNGYGGGIYFANLSSPRIVNCTFRGNRVVTATSSGGAIALRYGGGVPLIANCNFFGNFATLNGGAIYFQQVNPLTTHCTFSGNQVSSDGSEMGGAIFVQSDVAVTMDHCVFSRNTASRSGGGVGCYGSLVASNCTFIGNYGGNYYGGGLYLVFYTSPNNYARLVNCSFIGNRQTSYGGGGMYVARGNVWGNTTTVINCTFYCNIASGNSGGIMVTGGNKLYMTNCIVWSNFPYNVAVNASTATVAYTAIEGGFGAITNGDSSVVTDGGGNLGGDPLFTVVTGSWTAAGSYNTNLDQSTLIDGIATWTPNEHAGKAVWVNTNTSLAYFYVVTNTANTLTTQGSAHALGTNTAVYWIIDVHEKSKNGRYTPVGWVADPVHSPCIDAGEPNAPYALEPVPNGRRINMGCYGNTLEASMSYVPRGTLFYIR